MTYYVDGELFGEVEKYYTGDNVTVRDEPVKEGYTFSGWSSKEISNLGTSFEMPDKNVVIVGSFTSI